MIRNMDKDWRERVVKNNLDLIILRLLSSKPRWGYEVNIAIRDKFRVYLSAGTLYPLLHSLEEEDTYRANGNRRKVEEEESTRSQKPESAS